MAPRELPSRFDAALPGFARAPVPMPIAVLRLLRGAQGA
jgi:hypothetical protein